MDEQSWLGSSLGGGASSPGRRTCNHRGQVAFVDGQATSLGWGIEVVVWGTTSLGLWTTSLGRGTSSLGKGSDSFVSRTSSLGRGTSTVALHMHIMPGVLA